MVVNPITGDILTVARNNIPELAAILFDHTAAGEVVGVDSDEDIIKAIFVTFLKEKSKGGSAVALTAIRFGEAKTDMTAMLKHGWGKDIAELGDTDDSALCVFDPPVLLRDVAFLEIIEIVIAFVGENL